MGTSITFFPVDNGDMTLICLGDKTGTAILIDCNIRAAADDPNDKTRDVTHDLRDRLKKDSNGRPYVDAFLSTHPDQDHCRGIRNHFHMGSPADYTDDEKADREKRIIIGEMWSSPMVFRRAGVEHKLCDDAKAFNKEAKRRVALARTKNCSGIDDGDRILILGEDEDGKTDDILAIVMKVDKDITAINGKTSKVFKGRLLAPMPKSDKDDEEEEFRKNHSSVILNMELADDASRKTVKNILIGGDAEVAIWEKLWGKHKKATGVLTYDLLLTPHHCSWHSLSHDSRTDLGDKAKVSADAKSALSQIRKEGRIVASSCPIKDDDADPPCHAAKEVYKSIAEDASGEFLCTGEQPTEANPAPLEFTLSDQKLKKFTRQSSGGPRTVSKALIDDIGRRAAEAEAVRRGGNTRYA
jgi:hypothetical protein